MPRTKDNVGFRGRDTELLAALQMPTDQVLSIKEQIMSIMRKNMSGLTVDEIKTELGGEDYRCRRRVSDLVNENRLEDSGERRKLVSGRLGIVWTLTDQEVDRLL